MGLRPKLIIPLAALGLVRPLLSIFEVYERFEGPWDSVLVTAVIAAIWVGVVALRRVPSPFATLVAVSGLYGVFAIVLQRVVATFFVDSAPASLPMVAMVSIIVTNLIWGAVLGLVALAIRRAFNRDTPAAH